MRDQNRLAVARHALVTALVFERAQSHCLHVAHYEQQNDFVKDFCRSARFFFGGELILQFAVCPLTCRHAFHRQRH
jgi:hypothetical protein